MYAVEYNPQNGRYHEVLYMRSSAKAISLKQYTCSTSKDDDLMAIIETRVVRK